MSEPRITEPRIADRPPLPRAISVAVNAEGRVRLHFYSHTEARPPYQVRLSRGDALQFAQAIMQGLATRETSEVLLGFTPQLLALHRIEAVLASSTDLA